jgi:hypothetical protein
MSTSQKTRRDRSLIAKINGLEKELLVSSKECLILKDDLQVTKEKLFSVESSSVNSGEVVVTLNTELEKSKVGYTRGGQVVSNWLHDVPSSFKVDSYSYFQEIANP